MNGSRVDATQGMEALKHFYARPQKAWAMLEFSGIALFLFALDIVTVNWSIPPSIHFAPR